TAGGSTAGGSTAGGSTAGGSTGGGNALLCLRDGGLCTRLLWSGGPPFELASASADVNGLTFSFTTNGDGGTTAGLWRIPLDGGVGEPVPGSAGNGTVAATVLATNGSVFATTLIGVRPDLQSAFTQPPDAGAALTRHGQLTTSVRFTAMSNVMARALVPSHLTPLRTTVTGAEDVMVFSTVTDLVHVPPGVPFGGSGATGVVWAAYRFESSGATRLGTTAFSCLGNTSGLSVRGGVTLTDGGVCALISKACVNDDVKIVDVDNPGMMTVLRRDAGAAPGGELIVCGPPVPPSSSGGSVYTSRMVTLGPQMNTAMTAGAGALYVYRNGNVDRFLPGSMNSGAINAAPAGFVATPRGVYVVGSDRSLNQGYLEFLDPNMLRKFDEWRLSSTSDGGLNSLQLIAAAPNDDVWLVGTAAPGATLSSMDGGSLPIPSGVFAILLSP
ncbi:MAG: hypothetical protein GQE15_39345, partial [Archangiaceae bacterium]|nr:hypothetical protein [Archangiaceae bacterium]